MIVAPYVGVYLAHSCKLTIGTTTRPSLTGNEGLKMLVSCHFRNDRKRQVILERFMVVVTSGKSSYPSVSPDTPGKAVA